MKRSVVAASKGVNNVFKKIQKESSMLHTVAYKKKHAHESSDERKYSIKLL